MASLRVVASNSAGLRYSRLLCSRVPLYQPMYSTTARQAPARVGHACRSSSSPLMEPKKLSASALSQHWPVRPCDRSIRQSAARAANAAEVHWQPRSELSRIRLNSDHGTQYTAWAFGKRIRDAGLLGSMGTIGDCYDNAMMESLWHTMQLESQHVTDTPIVLAGDTCVLKFDFSSSSPCFQAPLHFTKNVGVGNIDTE